MKIALKIFGYILGLVLFFQLLITNVSAFSVQIQAVDDNNAPVAKLDENAAKARLTFTGLPANVEYKFCGLWQDGAADFVDCAHEVRLFTDSNGTTVVNVCGDKRESTLQLQGWLGLKFDVDPEYRKDHDRVDDCGSGDYFHRRKYNYELKQTNNDKIPGGESNFSVEAYYPKMEMTPTSPKPSDQLTLKITGGRRPYDDKNNRNQYKTTLKRSDGSKVTDKTINVNGVNGEASATYGPLPKGDYTLEIEGEWDHAPKPFKVFSIKITDTGGSITDSGSGAGVIPLSPGVNLCNPSGGPATSCKTALGNIPTDITGLTSRILSISLGLAGGIALIFMVYGSIKILTSSGDPKKVGDGRDIIVAAVAGLLFLIFSVLIMRYVGITLLPTNPF